MRWPILSILILSSFLWEACEKKIQLPQPNTTPHVVIEALLSDKAGEAKVHLTQSTDINNATLIPIHNATVQITNESTGKIDTFQETGNTGIYRNAQAKAIPQSTYHLSVKINGKIYEGRSHMPLNKIHLTHVNIIPTSPILNASTEGKNISLAVQFNNSSPFLPAQVAIQVLHKGRIVTTYLYTLPAPTTNVRRILNLRNILFSSQDSLIIHLQAITLELYQILLSIQRNSYQINAAPTTPITNLTNGALGYFEIYGSEMRTIKIKNKD